MIREVVKNILNNKKLTQSWLSNKTGISSGNISKYLSGKSDLTGASLEKIAYALDMKWILEKVENNEIIYNLKKLEHLNDLDKDLYIDDIPEVFKNDIIKYIRGKTILKDENNKVIISKKVFKKWLDKIKENGIDK